MKKTTKHAGAEDVASGDEQIAAWTQVQSSVQREACELLRGLIDAALPKATKKVWHGSPVWFLDGHPVVGYSTNKKGVALLFWNGQAFGEEGLQPMGSFRAAQAVFGDADGIDARTVRRWLKKAGADVLDSAALAKQMREARRK